MELRTENVTRYIMPLREGGSLPALAEAGWVQVRGEISGCRAWHEGFNCRADRGRDCPCLGSTSAGAGFSTTG